MISSKLEYKRPDNIEEAIQFYIQFQDEAVDLSGGTDLVPRLKLGLQRPKAVIDLKSIESLNTVEDQGDWVRIGGLMRLFDLKQNELIRDLFPALAASLDATSCETLQMRGTIAGNLLQDCRCLFYNQSEFWRRSKGLCLKMGGEKCNAVPGAKTCFANYCSDNAISLFSLSAQVELVGVDGPRRIPLEQLYTNKSRKPFNIKPGEILASIFIPKTKTVGHYEKLRVRGAIDYPLLGVAFSAANGTGKLAVGAIGAKPNAVEIEKPFDEKVDEAANGIRKHVKAVNNTVLDADYRKRMIPVLAKRVVNKVMEGAK